MRGKGIRPEKPGFAAIVTVDGKVVQSRACGVADISSVVPINTDTPFRIGSLTKTFTAAAIMLLAEQNNLNLAAPITDFVSGLPEAYRAISIQHLLNHTSGVPNYTNLAGFWIDHSERDVSPIEAVKYFTVPPLRFVPGTQFEYSNSGYILLGLAIEEISRLRLCDFLQAKFFDPLAMKRTALPPYRRSPPGAARGYRNIEGAYRDAIPMSFTWPYASGALVSSVNDLMNWQTALRSTQIISQRSLSAMTATPNFPDGSTSVYGSGWAIGSVGRAIFAYHSGSINGFASYMASHNSRNLHVAVLSNVQDFPAQDMGERLLSEFI